MHAVKSKAMLVVMLNLIFKSLLLFLSVNASVVSAEIYRGTDSKGNVYYSDQPFDDAVVFEPASISVVDSSKVKPGKDDAEKEPAQFKYTKFDIVSPVPNQVIRNEPDISISLQISPPLNIKQGHNVWLLMDGKPLVKKSQSMSLKIGRVDRGAHKFQAQVKDADGKIVARTRTTVAHIKYGAN